MSRPVKTIETSRLNLEMEKGVKKEIERIRDETNADSLGEVVRRAITIYNYCLEEQKAGNKLIIRGSNSEKEIVLV